MAENFARHDTPTAATAEYAPGRPRRPGDGCYGPAKRHALAHRAKRPTGGAEDVGGEPNVGFGALDGCKHFRVALIAAFEHRDHLPVRTASGHRGAGVGSRGRYLPASRSANNATVLA